MVTPEVDEAVNQFKAVNKAHPSKGALEAVHVIQSFSKEDSAKLSAKEVNELGMKLVQDYWPDHQFLVVTHTDTGLYHNHIVVNTLSMETGKRIQKKYLHWHALADRNDALSRERGLQVIERDPKSRRYKFPEKAKRMMEARGAFSYVHDMMQKANVAREFATSYDEYRGYLNLLGIGVRVEEKNITYFYPGKERGKRGDKLGEVFHKPSLEKQFKANDEKFAKNPELRSKIPLALEDAKTYKPYQAPPKNKNYAAFTKTDRHASPFDEMPELKHAEGFLPFAEIRKAKQGNILDYCRANKISLIDAGDGWHKLAKREHVLVSEGACKNLKNNQQGSLIDFVAAHHQITYIQAIAKINNNPKLLLLEKEFGEIKHTYTPFLVPNEKRMSPTAALGKLSQVMKANGADPKAAQSLLRNKQAYVSKEGAVHFLGKEEKDGTLEFTPDENGKYQKKVRGAITKPFHASRGSSPKAVLFVDPFSFIRKFGERALAPRARRESILALLEPNEKIVDSFLASNPRVKEISFAMPAHRSLSAGELDFFNVLKAKLAPFGVQVSMVPIEKTFSREGPSIGM